MTKNRIFIITFLLILVFSLSIKLNFSKSFYTETDDLIAVHQILNYKKLTLYDIANEKISPSYNSEIKKKIRSIQEKNNPFYNYIEKLSSKILQNSAPSKTSTFAPLQYILFADLINLEQNYEELKFNARLPSIIFSIIYLVITFYFCSLLFGKKSKYSILTILILSLSFPLIYISLRSYNYSAGTLSSTIILLFSYLELIKKNFLFFKIQEKNISLKNSFYLGIFFALLTYMSYSVFFLLPIYFIVNFYSNLELKNLFSKYNLNLFLTGIFFLIGSSPIIILIFKMNLYEYGITGSTAGNFREYQLSTTIKESGLIEIFLFFFKNFYLTVSKNLSFFLDNFVLSDLIQSFIFLLVLLGFFVSRNESENFKKFSNFSIFVIFYIFILVFFEIITLGPTRHSNFYTPLFTILFIISFRKIIDKYFYKIGNYILTIFVVSLLTIFTINLPKFYFKYNDVFKEKEFQSLINKYNVEYISNSPTYSDQICLMKIIISKIRTCPTRTYRYSEFIEFDDIDLEDIKNNNRSIMFLNNENSILNNREKLKKYDFRLIKSIDETKFKYFSPLMYISKYKPNLYIVKIYK